MSYAKWKNSKNIEKIQKKWRWLVMGGVFRVQCVRNHPKKEPLMHLKVWRRCGGGCGQR